VEGLERLGLLADAEEEDRLARDVADGQGCATAGVAASASK
jgi:hypothetical protein